ncbi:transposase [Streptomyces sp. NPDC055239]
MACEGGHVRSAEPKPVGSSPRARCGALPSARPRRNDITQTLALIEGIPPVAGRPGHPRRRPEAVLGDKVYDSRAVRHELRRRRIPPVSSRKGTPDATGLGRLRYVVEQSFALLHQFKRLAVRWERRLELHNAFVSLACSLICWRRLKKTGSRSRYELVR